MIYYISPPWRKGDNIVQLGGEKIQIDIRVGVNMLRIRQTSNWQWTDVKKIQSIFSLCFFSILHRIYYKLNLPNRYVIHTLLLYCPNFPFHSRTLNHYPIKLQYNIRKSIDFKFPFSLKGATLLRTSARRHLLIRYIQNS